MKNININWNHDHNNLITTHLKISKVIETTKEMAYKLSDTHIQESSWLIRNAVDNRCKWYCISDSSIPIVCWRKESCNNFNRSSNTLKSISEYEQKQQLEDLY